MMSVGRWTPATRSVNTPPGLWRQTGDRTRESWRETAMIARMCHYPASWDPCFKAYMTLADVYRYPTRHFEHHRRQLSLAEPG